MGKLGSKIFGLTEEVEVESGKPDMIQDVGVSKSSRQDPLIIEEGLMMRSRVKEVKELMGMFVKATIDDNML